MHHAANEKGAEDSRSRYAPKNITRPRSYFMPHGLIDIYALPKW